MMYRLRQAVREGLRLRELPKVARREYFRDHLGLVGKDPGVEKAIDCAVLWLCIAQDKSVSCDGGVAELYSLINGWGVSYPETTGYIIPTMLKYAELKDDNTIRHRAERMLDWLASIQLSDGSFQGGNIKAQPRVPTVFNTGQILLGLASGVKIFGDKYRESMRRAAAWLVDVQDQDGCWRKYPSPFVVPGEKTYDLHVAWGLLEAARLEPGTKYADAALRHVRWALRQQTSNGWFHHCCLDDPLRPLSHTLGYALRGILEAYRYTGEADLLKAGRKTAGGMLGAMREDGFLPGRLLSDWQGAVRWSCLTGTAQIAYCWLLMYQFTGEDKYQIAAYIANRYLRRRIYTSGPPEQRGGVKGAFPVNGAYHDYNYINWACKFFIDSNLLEKQIREQDKIRNGQNG